VIRYYQGDDEHRYHAIRIEPNREAVSQTAILRAAAGLYK